MSDPQRDGNNRNDPLSSLDEADRGDDTLGRYRYQTAVIAIYAMRLLDVSGELAALYCEHHEDFLLALPDGRLRGVQVKTRAENRPPLRVSDAGTKKALIRFIKKDIEYPGAFDRWVLETNGGFWQDRKDWYNLPFVLDKLRGAATDDTALSERAVAKCIGELAKESHADKSQILATLRKTYTQPNSGLHDIERRLVDVIQQHPLLYNHPARKGGEIARLLIERIVRASVPSEPFDFVAFARDPATAATVTSVQHKRISKQDLLAVFALAGIHGEYTSDGDLVEAVHPLGLPDGTAAPFVPSATSSMAPLPVSMLPRLSASTVESSSDSPDEKDAKAQLQLLQRMAEGGDSLAASKTLQILRESYWGKVKGPTRAIIANSQAFTAFHNDKPDLAQQYMEEALAYDPRNIVILYNSANIALLTGRPEEALEFSTQALEQDPVNEIAAAAFIQALYASGDEERLEATLADEKYRWIKVSRICRAALASIAHRSGDHDKALKLLTDVLSEPGVDERDSQYYTLLGAILFVPVNERIMRGEESRDTLSDDSKGRLERADTAYTRAAELLEKTDSTSWYRSALISRATVRFLLKRYEGALSDCERVLNAQANHRGALENKARILIDLDRAEEAIPYLESLVALFQNEPAEVGTYVSIRAGQGDFEAAKHMLAVAYQHAGRSSDILKLLGPLSGHSAPDALPPFALLGHAELLLQAATTDDVPETEPWVAEALRYIKDRCSGDAMATAVLAQYYGRRGDGERAIGYYREAINQANDSLKIVYQAALARLLYFQGEYAEAAALFRPLVVRNDDADLPIFAFSLYYAKQYGEALAVARRVREAQGARPGVSEIEVEVLEKQGYLDPAREVLSALIEAKPSEYKFQVRSAFLELRDGQHSEAKRIVEAIAYAAISGDAASLVNLAKLRALLKMPDALRYGYRARRLAFDDVEFHFAYLTLFQDLNEETEDAADFFRERTAVSIGDAVHVQQNGQTEVFVIEDEEPVHGARGEISPPDARAQRLLGKAQGDLVSLQEALNVDHRVEIVKIESKYRRAQVESTEMFQTGRLVHPALRVFDASSLEGIESTMRSMGRNEPMKLDAWEMYLKQPMPLVSFARMVNRPVLDIWLNLTEHDAGRIFAFDGSDAAEKEQMTFLASEGRRAVVIDMTALLTIVHLGLEQRIRASFDDLIVSRSTMDALQSYERELEAPGEMIGFVSFVGGTPIFSEMTSDQRDRRENVIRKAVAFVRSQTRIDAASGLPDANERYQKFLGEPTLSSVLVAVEQGAALYADDSRLRGFAKLIYGVPGIETQTLLRQCHQWGLMSADDLYDGLVRLAQAHYRNVYMDTRGILSLLERNVYRVGKDVLTAFSLFGGPDCDEDSAVRAMASILREAWTKMIFPPELSLITDAALNTVIAGRKAGTVLRKLDSVLEDEFALVPQKLREIRVQIKLWYAAKKRYVDGQN